MSSGEDGLFPGAPIGRGRPRRSASRPWGHSPAFAWNGAAPLDRDDRDFRDLFAEFYAHGVEFLVIGAHALAAHGHVRATKDLDVWVRPEPANAKRAFRALASYGAALRDLAETDLARPGLIFQIGVPPLRIDIVTSVDGLGFEEAWEGRMKTRFGDQEVAVLSMEHLIRNKRAAGRTQDLADVEALESLRRRKRR